jgi:hypothetical protein
MLFQHLDRLSGTDLLLMDRGYPSRWLVAALNVRGIGLCMRVQKAGNAGFACVRDFLRSDEHERIVRCPRLTGAMQRTTNARPRPRRCASCAMWLAPATSVS